MTDPYLEAQERVPADVSATALRWIARLVPSLAGAELADVLEIAHDSGSLEIGEGDELVAALVRNVYGWALAEEGGVP